MNSDGDLEILAAAVGQLVASGAAARPDHLSPAEIYAFAGGELGPEAAGEIREHLAVCASCSDRMLACGQAREPAPERWPAGWMLGAAAALALAAGLAAITLRPPAPTSPVLLQLAAAEDSVQRGPEDALEVPTFAADEPAVLAFELDAAAGQEVEILLYEEGSKTALLRAKSRLHAAGLATLALPAGALRPAVYRAEAGPPGGASRLTYTFQVTGFGSP